MDSENENDSAAPLPNLPTSIVARILSYNVETYQDVANLRLFDLVTLLPSLAVNGHHIQVPPKKHGTEAFPKNLGSADNFEFDRAHVTTGEKWVAPTALGARPEIFRLFKGALVEEMRFLKLPPTPSWGRSPKDEVPEPEEDNPIIILQGDTLVSIFRDTVEAVNGVEAVKHAQQLYVEAKSCGLFEPTTPKANEDESSDSPGDDTIGPFAVMLSLKVPADAACVVGTEENGILLLKAITFSDVNQEEIAPTFFPDKDHHGRTHRSIIHDDSNEQMYHVSLFMNILAESNSMNEMIYEEARESFPLCFDEMVKKYQNNTLVEGVAIVDKFISQEFRSELQRQIETLSELQRAENRVDYHPNSKDVVRDLVHPALYPYIKDVTPVRRNREDVEPASFSTCKAEGPCADEEDADPRLDTTTGPELDYWGRPYEDSIYQWLPTYFDISEDGQCTIEDYINNLVPRERYSDLYGCLAKLFGEALPYIESVYSYVRAVRPHLKGDEEDESYEFDSVEPLTPAYVPLRGQRLQVITKIVDYELHAGQSHEGVFHVEGMSHEEIVSTCLYILDRDESITGGDLLFKRAYLTDEMGTFIMTMPQCRHPQQDEIVQEGLLPLGRVETRKGRLIVFPNSHVHKVDTLINTTLAAEEGGDNGGVATRRIIVFFLVNPLKRIMSTREVAPQQKYAGGSLPLDDALAHRINLMQERKYHKQDWNVREVELCEH